MLSFFRHQLFSKYLSFVKQPWLVRHQRAIVLTAVLVLLGGTAFALDQAQRERGESEHEAVGEGNLPPALARHLEELSEAIPGNGGESEEGPGSAAADEFFARAYPGTDIPLARAEGARKAYTALKGKGVSASGAKPGSWASVGPSTAVYPFFDARDYRSYVPNEYIAAGRTTTMAIAPSCTATKCRVWIGAAGGGIWRTDRAMAAAPQWKYLSGSFEINSIGSIMPDPNDPTGDTLWVGTGEGNTCGSGCVHGRGLYKSTDGGNSWAGPYGKDTFGGRGVASIAIVPGSPNTMYAASTMGLHGMSSVCCDGVTRVVVPGAKPWGLYKSTDGGSTWSYIHAGAATTCGDDTAALASNTTPCTPRGTRQVLLDPSDSNTVYASSYARGVWRSTDAGATWSQIKASLNPGNVTTRPAIAVTKLASGDTRMYVSEGAQGTPYSRLFRSDAVATGSPAFSDLTSANPADPGYGSYNFCTGQCWYDNYVYSPAGHPDIVYLGGSYQYGETGGISNGRGVVLSTDAGASFTDLTMDATSVVHPNGMHPDQHAAITFPGQPLRPLVASDGGVVRLSGQYADVSANCNSRGLAGAELDRCHQLLSRVPTRLQSINDGLSTLQFLSLSVNPFDTADLQGGTQDNGTWESYGSSVKWPQTMIGDGGQSGFDVSNPHFRFHTFFNASPDVNFSDGAVGDWNWIADPIFQTEPQEFYVPIVTDPVVSRTMFVGTSHVWRTKTAGMGKMTLAELRQHCNEWTGDFKVRCGDWVKLGNPSASGQLTSDAYGDRAGGVVVAVERAPGDKSTLWAATSTGRVFVSHNADAEPASGVTFTRIDSLSGADPNRFVSGIFIDPANSDHAWLTYSGFSAATPSTPGHIFEVTAGGTWTSRDGGFGDIPATDVVRDTNGDLYVSSDYGVFRDAAGGGSDWALAASGMPAVEVAGLTIVPGARKLYAASHGLGAWSLNLA